jgi:hypothetical protein
MAVQNGLQGEGECIVKKDPFKRWLGCTHEGIMWGEFNRHTLRET